MSLNFEDLTFKTIQLLIKNNISIAESAYKTYSST